MRIKTSTWTIEGYLAAPRLIPEFQRKLVYGVTQKALLVASALKGLFIGAITLHKETGNILDGQQRSNLFEEVVNDQFIVTEKMFKDVPEQFRYSIPTSVLGLPFSKWKKRDQNRFLNATLVICEISGCSEEDARLQYWMMNSNMMVLNSEEKRKAITEGGIITDYKNKIAAWPMWESIFCASQIKRSRPEEFASELLMMVVTSKAGNKKHGLSDFVITNDQSESTVVEESYEKVKEICCIVNSILPDKAGKAHLHRHTHYYSLCHVVMNMMDNGMVLKNAEAAKETLTEFQFALNRPQEEENDNEIQVYKINSIQGSDSLQARTQRMGILQTRLLKHFKSLG